MKIVNFIQLASLAAGATAEAPDNRFEVQDFNVTAALEELGVVIELLPQPLTEALNLGERSFSTPCSLAVGGIHSKGSLLLADSGAVHIPEHPFWKRQAHIRGVISLQLIHWSILVCSTRCSEPIMYF